MQRARVFYSGRVQGVGFRFTAQRLAQGLPIAGTVRNLADGRVELLAEGEPAALERFLAAIRSELGAKIHDYDHQDEPFGSEPLDGFTILH